MVCNFMCKLQKKNHFCTKAENLVSLWAVVTQLHPNFHSLYILEFHGKAVVTIQN